MILTHVATVNFDPSNKHHRAAVKAFMKRRAWSDSPLRFSYDPEYGSVIDQVQAKLLQWYMDQEEAKAVKKPKSVTKVASKTLAFQMMGVASEFQN